MNIDYTCISGLLLAHILCKLFAKSDICVYCSLCQIKNKIKCVIYILQVSIAIYNEEEINKYIAKEVLNPPPK